MVVAAAMGATLLIILFSSILLSRNLFEVRGELASSPPRGWNSYDSFSWVIDEEAFLGNAEILARRLLPYGYEYVVVDYLWYRKNVDGSYSDSYGYDSIDEWGRVIPDPDRWPSSRGSKGFKEVAQKVHDMGLKFGIHVMRGISTQAVQAGTPILDVFKGASYMEAGRQWNARDIGLKNMTCAWMQHGFMSVNTDLGAGQAFLRSLYQQYAEWGVDFVKLDCIFGDDLDSKEIITVSKLLEELDRPMLFSLSPGTSVTPSMAEGISNHVNMYRITGDDWDKWEDVAAHFDVSRDFAAANKIGADGLHGRSWPDLDMLPLGWLTDPGVKQGPHRKCNLTLDEQRTQITLWSMAKSPLMFGGDLRHIDETTFNLITHPTLLEINAYSTNNKEFQPIFARDIKSTRRSLSQRFMSLKHANIPDDRFMTFTSCNNERSKRWFTAKQVSEPDQICWNHNKKTSANTSYCLFKRKPLLTSDEETICNEKYHGKFQLSANKIMDTCLDTHVKRKRTASEIESTLLSPCKWNANQIWELTDKGTLVNSNSGMCATMQLKKGNTVTSGSRAWVAIGRSGEIYLSFFNLDPKRRIISARIKDLAKALDNSFISNGSCNCTEVWSGKTFGVVKQTLSIPVETHSCALFILDCKNYRHGFR